MHKLESYKDVRICCYAMTADEPEEFIDRWLKSMSGADIITVLVTKLNNPNYTYFKQKQQLPEFKDKLIVEEEGITPWRFDAARNASMRLIPEKDCDVCVCTDVDEILIEDFWDDLRKEVFAHPNFERIHYQYAWSHDTEGKPKWYFWYDKIHQPKGWRWEFPVHETLTCPDKEQLGYSGCYNLDSGKIYLHHYPDQTKSRGSYLGLLKLRAKEHPEDLYGLYYLAREYNFHNDLTNAVKTAFSLYIRLLQNRTLEEAIKFDDMLMLPSIAVMIADFLKTLKMKTEAEFFYRRALDIDPTFREAYMKLAQLLAYQPNRHQECYETLTTMEQRSRYVVDWRLSTCMWREWKRLQILADAHCWEGKYEEAYKLIQEALKDIKTADDKVDAASENFFGDLDFILEKVGKKVN